MSAQFVKPCPLCGHDNLAIASFCAECDADLMNVAVEMRASEPIPPESPALPPIASSPSAIAPAVPASASHPSPPAARPINQNEMATTRTDVAGGTLELELVANPSIRFRIRDGQSVGRSERADVVLHDVPELEYISRAHARFTRRRTQWYIQYIAQGNSITVDGQESHDDAEIAIYENSVIVLSFTAFRVKLG